MENKDWIEINQLSTHYQVEVSFLHQIDDLGIVKFSENKSLLHPDDLRTIEKVIRLHNDLKVNLEGIDIIFNLLEKIDSLQHDLKATQTRLKIYVED